MKGEIVAIEKLEDDNKLVRYHLSIVTDEIPKLLLGSCEVSNIVSCEEDARIEYTG